ncbi:DUF485 domain-containing protein [Acidocella facilis]|uniref:DUF485 domain-containing protein n=1 Tax=Acidocella facilis TaxID=525 RepID=UPI001F450041|nr:DUF485 domain-containing protein [Acidocella facilis]
MSKIITEISSLHALERRPVAAVEEISIQQVLLGPEKITELVQTRFRISLIYTLSILAIYIGFILLVAYGQGFLATLLFSGFSMAILLGALVVISAVILTCAYGAWIVRFEKMVRNLNEAGGCTK